jgi:hemolysin III
MDLDGKHTLGEEIANAISHGVSALFGLVALILLLIKGNTPEEIASGIIFGLGMIFLFTMSTLYHSFKRQSVVKNVFKRFDHLSIYILIGSTFAPVFIIVIDKPLGWILLAGQWVIIIVGIVLKATLINRFAILHLIAYLLLGWSALTLVGPLYQTSSTAFYLILAGGLSYTIGVLFYAFKWFKFSHLVWHIFVFGGTFFHFLAIYLYIFGSI